MPDIEYTRTRVINAKGKARMVDVPRIFCSHVGVKVSPEDFELYAAVVASELADIEADEEAAYSDSLAVCG